MRKFFGINDIMYCLGQEKFLELRLVFDFLGFAGYIWCILENEFVLIFRIIGSEAISLGVPAMLIL